MNFTFCTLISLALELSQCWTRDSSLCCCITVGSATQRPLCCTANVPLAKSNLGFAYISQGIPRIISNDKLSTIKFTNACQGPIYTNPADRPIERKRSPLANLTLTSSAVDKAHPKRFTTNKDIKLKLAPVSINAVHSYDLCAASFT